jgi:hypothetical protein
LILRNPFNNSWGTPEIFCSCSLNYILSGKLDSKNVSVGRNKETPTGLEFIVAEKGKGVAKYCLSLIIT